METLELARDPARVVVHDVHLAAQNRLDPVLLTGRVHLNGPLHDPVIG